MRLKGEQLHAALARGLAGTYLVSGDEPLLVGEAADAIRAAARAGKFTDRRVFDVDGSFSWDDFRDETRSPSLFADRRLFEVRMPTGKPDEGAALIAQLAARPEPDLLLLLVAGKLERKTVDSPWVRAIAEHGVWVTVWPITAAELPVWLCARAQRSGHELEPQAARLIADRVEGNLLAAKQELDNLVLLANGERISLELAKSVVADSARYDVFQLAESAAGGDAARALRILDGLRSEGREPALVLWAIVRELRGLWQAGERLRLRTSQRSAWNTVATPSERALARLGELPLPALLGAAARADRVVKGAARGDPWTELAGLTAMLAGALQPRRVSGRVSG
ncbi:MAG TPA: DNA polymerase III subunit delta [Steroidobacteraceae bacterium]|nr:DNA polymerase III subunit delta [Steroidobacteraceae bacterium]